MTKNDVLKQYIKPFGAMSKSEFEILLFMSLQDENYFGEGKNYDLYTIQSKLNVTKAKARNLVYAGELRRLNSEDDTLDANLMECLLKAHFFYEKDSRNISLEIENPLLIDYLKHKLKEIGYITDASFSPDLIKMSIDAYSSILEFYRKKNSTIDNNINNVYQELIQLGVIVNKPKNKTKNKSNNIKDILLAIGRIAGTKLIEEIVGSGYNLLGSILAGDTDWLIACIQKYLKNSMF